MSVVERAGKRHRQDPPSGRVLRSPSAEQQKLASATSALGVQGARPHTYPDGCLAAVALEELVARVTEEVGYAELLLVFDVGGITGHPDHGWPGALSW